MRFGDGRRITEHQCILSLIAEYITDTKIRVAAIAMINTNTVAVAMSDLWWLIL